jgi:hypothetical protein
MAEMGPGLRREGRNGVEYPVGTTSAVSDRMETPVPAPTDPQPALRVSLPQLSCKDEGHGGGSGWGGTGGGLNPTGC